jgi:short-subunit dehydrogenase
MSQLFANQVVVITGASSGIGWSLARVLAAGGARVGLVARRVELLDALAAEVRQAGGTAEAAAADVGDRRQVHDAIGALTAKLGPADLLVANAGLSRPTLVEPPNVPDVEEMVRVNLLGVIYAVEAVLPEMLRRDRGHLAAVSSLAAYRGLPGHSVYCATKAAVNSYLEGLRVQLRYRGIAVTTVCPGFIRTPMTDVNEFYMPFLMEPDAAAHRIARALRRRQKVYNFPWQMGLLAKLAGWVPDWLLARAVPHKQGKPTVPPEVA